MAGIGGGLASFAWGAPSNWSAAILAAPFVRSAAALTSQTITFGALAGKTYGAAPFAVSATASSGLAVSFASLTLPVCTVSGTTVTVVAAGTCTIRASQAGNATYTAAPNVNQSFTVAKTTQTISFGTLVGKTYGVAPFAVSATASSGLAAVFTSTTPTVCTVSGSAVTIVAAGTCTLQASQAGNANYLAATSVNQSFAVAKASQTITFGTLSARAYGSGTITLSATAASGLAVTFASTTTGICTVAGSTVTLVAVGACTIQAAQAGNANYSTAANVSQSFSVTKASQTITFGALTSRALGSGTFTLSATASSALTVTFASLTTSVCTVSTKTVTLLSIGTCTIQALQTGNATWNSAPNVNQSFTVTPATQTINFPAIAPQLWGNSWFYLNATASSGLPIAFITLTPSICSVASNRLTLQNVGSCTILATQAGNASYVAANASRTFGVIAPLQFALFDVYPTGTPSWGVVAADFGSDSKPDVAFANTGSNTVSLLFGTGDGTLVAGGTLASGNFPQALAFGDLNGDGHPDLIVANARDSTVSVYLGNGDSTFAPSRTTAVRPSPAALALADVNGDGKLDLMIANGYTGDYSGSNSIGASVEVLLGNGDGTFQASNALGVISNAQGLAIADVTGDGKPDVLVTNGFSNSFTVLPGRGDGTFTLGNGYGTDSAPAGIAVADFNGDGRRDVVVVNSQSDTLSIFLGNGDGTFGVPTTIGVNTGPRNIVVADFNGDGRPDLAVTTAVGIDVFAGMGNGTFAPALALNYGFGTTALFAIDLDRDGRLDLVATDYADNTLGVLLNTGSVGTGATIVPYAGTPQSALVNTPYAVPLSVLVRGSTNQPLPGQGVVFSAPTIGPAGFFTSYGAVVGVTTDDAGVATAPTFYADLTAGAFSVLASIGSASTNFFLINVGTSNQAPSFLSTPLPNGALNAPYAYTVSASGSPAPTISTLANGLPPGLTLDGSIGLVAGTPTTAGTYLGSLTASNGVPPNATQAFSVTIATGTQTITFGSIANVTLGVPPFSISASASSGLPVTFTSLTTGTCTVSGSTVTVAAAGTCTIQAGQPGNAIYSPATNVSRSFSVSKLPQTITFGALFNQNLGSAPFSVIATASSGLVVSFSSLTAGVCAVSGVTVTPVTTGTCSIRASQAGNVTYAAAPNVDQGFTVKPVGGDQAPTIVFKTPVNNSAYVAPAIIPLYATASDSDGTVARVEFYSGATLLGSATATPFRYVWTNVAAGTYSLTAKAYDDLGVTTTTSAVTVTVNATGSTIAFGQAQSAPLFRQLIPGEFNNDSRLDVVMPGTASISFALGNGNGTFAVGSGLAVTGPCFNAEFQLPDLGDGIRGDFNGDGKPDIAMVGSPGCIAIAASNADGTLRAPLSYSVAFEPRGLTGGDFNGDGKLDVATGNQDGTIAIFLGNGNGTLQSASVIPAGTALTGIVAGDFTGDSKQDLLAINVSDNTLRLLRGNGNGTFQPATTIAFAGSHALVKVVAGDFNGDGKLDVAITDAGSTGAVIVMIGNGDGTFHPPVEYPAGPSPASILAADLNGDGWLDLAVTNYDWTSTVSVLLGNGNGTFRAPVAWPVTSYPYNLAAGDVTGDGKPDLVVAGTNGGSVLINITGVATQAPAFTNGPPPDGYAGVPYSFTFTASGSPPPTFRFGSATPVSPTLNSTGLFADTDGPGPIGSTQVSIIASNGVAPDATYTFPFVVREAAQTINFPPVADVPFAEPCLSSCYLTLAITASSGMPIFLSSLTPSVCSVDISGRVQLLTIGTCTLRAEQPGDLYFAAAPIVDRSFAITLATYTVAITAPADHAGFVAPASIVISADAVAAQGYVVTNVMFFRDGVPIGTVTSPPYTIAWPSVAAGTYSLVAQSTQHAAGANDIVTASLPVTVIVSSAAVLPIVSLTTPATGSRYYAPATVALAANASIPSGSITKVDFYNGPFQIGTASTSPYAFDWTDVRTGTYKLTARATSAADVVATSTPVTITVDLDAALPIAAYTFNETWDSSGVAQDLIGGFYADRRGNVAQVAAGASAPKPDTCKAANFTGGTLDVTGLNVSNLAGARTAVAFWMNWNGADGAMPLSFATEGLSLSAGGFGFTTSNGDLYGIASAPLANGWHHVAAEFNNGGVTANRLSIDGVPQPLTQRTGTPTNANAVVSGSLRLGGQSGTSSLRFTGQLDEVYVFEGGLSPTHVTALATAANACAPISVLFASPANNATFIAPATIEFVAGAATQNGFVERIEFFNGATLLGTAHSGQLPFAYRWLDVAPGAYTLTARAHDTTGGTATSAPVTVTVNSLPTAHATVSIAAPASGATFYAAGTVPIVANISASPSYVVRRAVFRANGNQIGVVTSAPWTFNLVSPLPANYALTVEIVDNAGYRLTSAPVTITVLPNLPPTVSLTSPTEGQTFGTSASIALSANASDPDGSVAKVEFYAGATLIGTKTSAPFAVSWSGAAAGSYTLTAKATDNTGAATMSVPVHIAVVGTPTVTLTAPSTGATYSLGQSILMTAQAATPGHTLSRIDFASDGVVLGSVPVPGGVTTATVSYTWAGAANGAHALKATAVATDAFTVTSAAVNVAVTDLAVALIEPSAGQFYQPPVDIRITANPTETGGTIAQVDFYGDGALLGSRTAPPYTFVWMGVPVGTHTVSAKVRDVAGFIASSTSVSVTVIAAPTIQLDSGIDGGTVSDDNATISGTVQAPLNSAVIVNGKGAALDRYGRFFVDNVPLQPGSNTLSLVLNTQEGLPVTRTIAVGSAGTAPFQVTLDPQEGLAPLSATMIITNRGNVAFQRIEVDTNDDGTAELTLNGLTDNEVVLALSFPTPGTYTIRVTAYGPSNNVIYLTRRKVRAYSPTELGTITATVFNGMVDRLRAGNIAGALNAVTATVRDKYNEIITAVGSGWAIAADTIGSIQAGRISDGFVEYLVVRNKSDGPNGYLIYLIRGVDGVWRLDGM